MNIPVAADDVVYVLDSNIFIEAKRRYYAFDVCPGFWSALLWHYQHGRIFSVDRVKSEIERLADDLWDWVSTRMPDACFRDTDVDAVTQAYGEAIAWAVGQAQFEDAAKAEFAAAENADAWVIALARAVGATVVTHEALAPNVRRRVPIPNVCQALGIPYVDTFDMLRRLATQFSWQAP